MKRISRLFLIVLCAAVLAGTFAGCAPKGEGVAPTGFTEKDWTAAIDGLKSTSITLNIANEITGDGESASRIEGVFMLEGTKMYSTYLNILYAENVGEEYFIYDKGTDHNWTKNIVSENGFAAYNIATSAHTIVKDIAFADFVIVGENYEMKSDKLSSVVSVQGLSKFTVSFDTDKKIKSIYYEVSSQNSTTKIDVKDYGTTQVTIPTSLQSVLTRAEWSEAMEAFNCMNVTLDIVVNIDGVGSDAGKHEGTFAIAEKKMSNTYRSEEYYENVSKEYFKYQKDVDGKWNKTSISVDDFVASNLVNLYYKQFLQNLQFYDFVLVGDSYEIKSDKLASISPDNPDLNFLIFTVSFGADKKIKSISYEESSQKLTTKINVKDYGTTQVTIPTV